MWRQTDHSELAFNVFAIFPHDTQYFGPGPSGFMINLRVDDLDALLKALREEGVQVEDKVDEYDFGKFRMGHRSGGQRVELWEPPKANQP